VPTPAPALIVVATPGIGSSTTEASSARSPSTTSAPVSASRRAGSEPAPRVIARTVNGPSGSARIARAKPPPLLHELERSDSETGFVTICCGGGLGTGTILQRV
jgi:hypothetical protein